jgi:hypothetical protein
MTAFFTSLPNEIHLLINTIEEISSAANCFTSPLGLLLIFGCGGSGVSRPSVDSRKIWKVEMILRTTLSLFQLSEANTSTLFTMTSSVFSPSDFQSPNRSFSQSPCCTPCSGSSNTSLTPSQGFASGSTPRPRRRGSAIRWTSGRCKGSIG